MIDKIKGFIQKNKFILKFIPVERLKQEGISPLLKKFGLDMIPSDALEMVDDVLKGILEEKDYKNLLELAESEEVRNLLDSVSQFIPVETETNPALTQELVNTVQKHKYGEHNLIKCPHCEKAFH